MVVRSLPGEELSQRLQSAVPGCVERWQNDAVWVSPSSISDAALFLRDDPNLDLQFLNAVSAVDFVEYFEIVYHLTSFNKQHTAIVKTKLYGREGLRLPSVYHIWRGADFQEREVWDLMGIYFDGHPNMKRIFMWEGFEGHPLRKDFL